jgi:hypothetical protein
MKYHCQAVADGVGLAPHHWLSEATVMQSRERP